MSTMYDGRTRWPHDWNPQPAPVSHTLDAIVDAWTWWAEQIGAAWMALGEHAVQAAISAWEIHGPEFARV